MTGDLVSEHQEGWPTHLVLQDDSSGNGIVGRWEGLARTQVRKGEEEKWVTADPGRRRERGEWRTLRATRSHTDH